MENILVTGAGGQIGSELVEVLRQQFPEKRIISLDIKAKPNQENDPDFLAVNILDKPLLERIYSEFKPVQVYHLAAILSAAGEKDPLRTWDLNMEGLLNILDLSVKYKTGKLFWPSSIAVFGPYPTTSRSGQNEKMAPITVYGISKLAGENWCHYYRHQYGLDVRSLRFPGLISWKTAPGGGTTDYAVQIYLDAVEGKTHSCYLAPTTYLPMMYMPDAIRAIMELMRTDAYRLKNHLAYNLSGFSACPNDFMGSIKEIQPDFNMETLEGDSRQKIADSWPNDIDDTQAQVDWNWKRDYDLKATTYAMIHHLKAEKDKEAVLA